MFERIFSDHLIVFTYELMVVLVLGLSTVNTRDNTRLVGVMLATLGHGFFSAIRIAFSPNLKGELRALTFEVVNNLTQTIYTIKRTFSSPLL